MHWNKRLKALGAFVPIQHVDEAKYEISERLLPDDTMGTRTNLYLERYVFVPPEESLGEDPEHLIAYQSFVHRQRSHVEHLKYKLSVQIKVNLDLKLNSRKDPTLTLRRIVLAILVKDKTSPLFGNPLFHSVDFVPDVSKLWIPNKPEDAKSAVVFTYYKPVEKEAAQMVAGLGRYVARVYGSDPAKKAFTSAHWESTKGWKYKV